MALTPYRLARGDTGPRQQSAVTCGSACLTVARMLVDPAFAQWVATGRGAREGGPVGASPADRFAAYERIVHRRTNGLAAPGGGVSMPWPRWLGTPPWGAKDELEYGAARRGSRYQVTLLRHEPPGARAAAFDRLEAVLVDGQPALLYVGNGWLPRHVVLVLPGPGDALLDVYDPATGRVATRTRDDVASAHLALSGWDVPWFLVAPSGPYAARARGLARFAAPSATRGLSPDPSF